LPIDVGSRVLDDGAMLALTESRHDLRFTVRKERRRRGFVIRDDGGKEIAFTANPGPYRAEITTPRGFYRMQIAPKATTRDDLRGRLLARQWEVVQDSGEVRYQLFLRHSRVDNMRPYGGRLWMRCPSRRRVSALGLYREKDDRAHLVGMAGRRGLPFLRVFKVASDVVVSPEIPPQEDPVLFVAVMFLLSCSPALGIEVG
jgi:hypothetical protein